MSCWYGEEELKYKTAQENREDGWYPDAQGPDATMPHRDAIGVFGEVQTEQDLAGVYYNGIALARRIRIVVRARSATRMASWKPTVVVSSGRI